MKRKRAGLRETPLAKERVAIVERAFPYFARLSDEDRRELLGHMQVFLAEKRFEGCDGLEITDEMKLTIAAQACLLLLHRDTDYYPGLDVILVYPHAYHSKITSRTGGVVLERDVGRLGESHRAGIVVLSWDAVRSGASDPHDGHNVVLHEFAHQLDQEDGASDGAPILDRRSSYVSWARVLGAEFETLSHDVEENQRTVLDAYGSTSPAEFFAVATETFFEKPEQLQSKHPELYAELASYYKQDPLARLGIAPKAPTRPARKLAIREAPKVDRVETITLCKMHSSNATRKLVGVSDAYRDAVLALGCEPVGFLGTLHRVRKTKSRHREWGFVAEVLRCPDASVAGALYHFDRYRDGLALDTLLDNGTIVATETSEAPSATPAELYEAHLRHVREIAAREDAKPIEHEPFALYAAARLQTTDLSMARDAYIASFERSAFRVLFIVVAIALASLTFRLVPARQIGIGVGADRLADGRVRRRVVRRDSDRRDLRASIPRPTIESGGAARPRRPHRRRDRAASRPSHSREAGVMANE